MWEWYCCWGSGLNDGGWIGWWKKYLNICKFSNNTNMLCFVLLRTVALVVGVWICWHTTIVVAIQPLLGLLLLLHTPADGVDIYFIHMYVKYFRLLVTLWNINRKVHKIYDKWGFIHKIYQMETIMKNGVIILSDSLFMYCLYHSFVYSYVDIL